MREQWARAAKSGGVVTEDGVLLQPAAVAALPPARLAELKTHGDLWSKGLTYEQVQAALQAGAAATPTADAPVAADNGAAAEGTPTAQPSDASTATAVATLTESSAGSAATASAAADASSVQPAGAAASGVDAAVAAVQSAKDADAAVAVASSFASQAAEAAEASAEPGTEPAASSAARVLVAEVSADGHPASLYGNIDDDDVDAAAAAAAVTDSASSVSSFGGSAQADSPLSADATVSQEQRTASELQPPSAAVSAPSATGHSPNSSQHHAASAAATSHADGSAAVPAEDAESEFVLLLPDLLAQGLPSAGVLDALRQSSQSAAHTAAGGVGVLDAPATTAAEWVQQHRAGMQSLPQLLAAVRDRRARAAAAQLDAAPKPPAASPPQQAPIEDAVEDGGFFSAIGSGLSTVGSSISSVGSGFASAWSSVKGLVGLGDDAAAANAAAEAAATAEAEAAAAALAAQDAADRQALMQPLLDATLPLPLLTAASWPLRRPTAARPHSRRSCGAFGGRYLSSWPTSQPPVELLPLSAPDADLHVGVGPGPSAAAIADASAALSAALRTSNRLPVAVRFADRMRHLTADVMLDAHHEAHPSTEHAGILAAARSVRGPGTVPPRAYDVTLLGLYSALSSRVSATKRPSATDGVRCLRSLGRRRAACVLAGVAHDDFPPELSTAAWLTSELVEQPHAADLVPQAAVVGRRTTAAGTGWAAAPAATAASAGSTLSGSGGGGAVANAAAAALAETAAFMATFPYDQPNATTWPAPAPVHTGIPHRVSPVLATPEPEDLAQGADASFPAPPPAVASPASDATADAVDDEEAHQQLEWETRVRSLRQSLQHVASQAWSKAEPTTRSTYGWHAAHPLLPVPIDFTRIGWTELPADAPAHATAHAATAAEGSAGTLAGHPPAHKLPPRFGMPVLASLARLPMVTPDVIHVSKPSDADAALALSPLALAWQKAIASVSPTPTTAPLSQAATLLQVLGAPLFMFNKPALTLGAVQLPGEHTSQVSDASGSADAAAAEGVPPATPPVADDDVSVYLLPVWHPRRLASVCPAPAGSTASSSARPPPVLYNGLGAGVFYCTASDRLRAQLDAAAKLSAARSSAAAAAASAAADLPPPTEDAGDMVVNVGPAGARRQVALRRGGFLEAEMSWIFGGDEMLGLPPSQMPHYISAEERRGMAQHLQQHNAVKAYVSKPSATTDGSAASAAAASDGGRKKTLSGPFSRDFLRRVQQRLLGSPARPEPGDAPAAATGAAETVAAAGAAGAAAHAATPEPFHVPGFGPVATGARDGRDGPAAAE